MCTGGSRIQSEFFSTCACLHCTWICHMLNSLTHRNECALVHLTNSLLNSKLHFIHVQSGAYHLCHITQPFATQRAESRIKTVVDYAWSEFYSQVSQGTEQCGAAVRELGWDIGKVRFKSLLSYETYRRALGQVSHSARMITWAATRFAVLNSLGIVWMRLIVMQCLSYSHGAVMY